MTYFGKNIRKIRSIQKLSQTNFAELFGLSRASIGAYEEGRAEAKLDVIIEIAKHFSITVDDLINKEITVNELYHFNIFDENISAKMNLGSEMLSKLVFCEIPLVSSHDLLMKSIEEVNENAENKIVLPGSKSQNRLALLVDLLNFKYFPKEVKSNDILILDLNYEFDKATDFTGVTWIVKANKTIYLGDIKHLNENDFIFFPNQGSPIGLPKIDVEIMLPVDVHIENKPVMDKGEADRIDRLEKQVNDLYNRL